MTDDPTRFAIDDGRWREEIVPRVLREDLALPHHDDEAPMGALELLITTELPEGVLQRPEGWDLHLIDDDGPDSCGLIVGVRPTDPAGVILSAGWSEWGNFLPDDDTLAELEPLQPLARLANEALLLRAAVDHVLAAANGLLAATARARRAAILGEVILSRVPGHLDEDRSARLAQALDHSTLGEVVAACLASLGGGDR